MNTYRNRRPGNPWHGVKPASTVTADEAEATRMAAQIAELCERQVWERFMLYRMAETSMETLRKFHAELTAPAIEALEALEADWREDQADRLDYARGQY